MDEKIKLASTYSFGFGPALSYTSDEWEAAIRNIKSSPSFNDYRFQTRLATTMLGIPHSQPVPPTLVGNYDGITFTLKPHNCRIQVPAKDSFADAALEAAGVLIRIAKYWDKPICLPGLEIEFDSDTVPSDKMLEFLNLFPSDEFSLELKFKPKAEKCPLVTNGVLYIQKSSDCVHFKIGVYSTLSDEELNIIGYESSSFLDSDGLFRNFLNQAAEFITSESEAWK